MQVATGFRRLGAQTGQATTNLTTVFIGAMLFALLANSAQAQTFRVLYKFTGGPDGSLAQPFSDVIQDASGNLYGTTSGFDCGRCSPAPGAVFKLSSSGKETTLHTFDCNTEGCNPLAGLVADKSRSLYGTTESGNTVWGVVYKLDDTQHETVVHSFTGSDGKLPQSRLILDTAGNFYGTTSSGGDLSCFPSAGCGVVFEISNTGEFKVLYRFTGGQDGQQPSGGLVLDAEGNLYGSTTYGGGSGCYLNLGCGTVFRIDANGQESVLYSFSEGADGYAPAGDLLLDRSGNLYGTTTFGGSSFRVCSAGCGVVFKLDKGGVETVLHRFGGGEDGANPLAGLVRDTAGNFYGTTSYGSATIKGTVFRLSPYGKEMVLHRFSGADGALPEAKLLLDPHGTLYGTTRFGGDLNCTVDDPGVGCGVVFAISR